MQKAGEKVGLYDNISLAQARRDLQYMKNNYCEPDRKIFTLKMKNEKENYFMEMAKCFVIIIISSICAIYSLDKAINGFVIRGVPRDEDPPSLVTIILQVLAFGIFMSIDVSYINYLIHSLSR